MVTSESLQCPNSLLVQNVKRPHSTFHFQILSIFVVLKHCPTKIVRMLMLVICECFMRQTDSIYIQFITKQ